MKLVVSTEDTARVHGNKLVFHDSPGYAQMNGTVTMNTAWVDQALQKKIVNFSQAKDVLSAMLRHEMNHVLCDHGVKQYAWLRSAGYKPERLHTPAQIKKALKYKDFVSYCYMQRAFERQADVYATMDHAGNTVPESIRGALTYFSTISAHADIKKLGFWDGVEDTHPSAQSRYAYFAHLKDVHEHNQPLSKREQAQIVLCGNEKDPHKQCPRFIDAWIKASQKSATK